MKNCFFILTLALVSIFNQAFTTPVEKLAECKTDVDTVFVTVGTLNEKLARIESDLINNKWGSQDVEFNFSDLGMLTTISADQTRSEEHAIWRVAVEDGRLVLIITNTATDEYTVYNVEETSKGITLTNGTLNKELALVIIE